MDIVNPQKNEPTGTFPGQQLPVVQQAAYVYVPKPPCHVDGTFVFNLGKARIHAGSSKAPSLKEWGLIINIKGYRNYSVDIEALDGASKIVPKFLGVQKKYKEYPELVIDWRDGGVPEIRRKEWRKLIEDLQEFNGDVLVHCVGGHGRTGTLLAILGGVSGAIPGDPVEWLRKNYCDKVVETSTQISYLKKNMNLPVKAEATYKPTVIPGFTQYTQYTGGIQRTTDWEKWYQEKYGNINEPITVNTPDVTLPAQTFTCILCKRVKSKGQMFSHFVDGSGYCYLCHVGADSRYEG